MVYDTVVYNEKFVSRNEIHTIIHPNVSEMYFGCVYRRENSRFEFYTQYWSRNSINNNENIIYKRNLTINITAKHNLSFNADSTKLLSTLKSPIYDLHVLFYNFGLWTVNKKWNIMCDFAL